MNFEPLSWKVEDIWATWHKSPASKKTWRSNTWQSITVVYEINSPWRPKAFHKVESTPQRSCSIERFHPTNSWNLLMNFEPLSWKVEDVSPTRHKSPASKKTWGSNTRQSITAVYEIHSPWRPKAFHKVKSTPQRSCSIERFHPTNSWNLLMNFEPLSWKVEDVSPTWHKSPASKKTWGSNTRQSITAVYEIHSPWRPKAFHKVKSTPQRSCNIERFHPTNSWNLLMNFEPLSWKVEDVSPTWHKSPASKKTWGSNTRQSITAVYEIHSPWRPKAFHNVESTPQRSCSIEPFHPTDS